MNLFQFRTASLYAGGRRGGTNGASGRPRFWSVERLVLKHAQGEHSRLHKTATAAYRVLAAQPDGL